MTNTVYRNHKEILAEAKNRGLVDYTVYEVENLRKDFECTYEARARTINNIGIDRCTQKFDAFSNAAKQLAYDLAEKRAIQKAIERLFPGISIADQPKPDSYRVKWAKNQIAEGNCTKEEIQNIIIEITSIPGGQKLDDLPSDMWVNLEYTILYGFCPIADNSKTRWLSDQRASTATTKIIKDSQFIYTGRTFIVDYSTVTEPQWENIKSMIEKSIQSIKQPRYIPIFETNRQSWLDARVEQYSLSEDQVREALVKSGGEMAALESLEAKQFEVFKYWIEKSGRKNAGPDKSLDAWIIRMGTRGAKDKDFWSAASAASVNRTTDLRKLSNYEIVQAKEYLENLLTERNVLKTNNPFTKIKGYDTNKTTSRFQWVVKMVASGISETDIVSATRQATSGRTGNLSELSPEEFTSIQRIIEGSDDAEYDIQDELVIKSARGTWVLENKGKLSFAELQTMALKITETPILLNDMNGTQWKKFKSAVKANQPKSKRGGLDPTIVSLVSRLRTRNFDDLTDYEYEKARKIAQICEEREPTSEDREDYLARLLKDGVPWAEIQMWLGSISGGGLANCLDLTEEQWYNFKQRVDKAPKSTPQLLRKFNFEE